MNVSLRSCLVALRVGVTVSMAWSCGGSPRFERTGSSTTDGRQAGAAVPGIGPGPDAPGSGVGGTPGSGGRSADGGVIPIGPPAPAPTTTGGTSGSGGILGTGGVVIGGNSASGGSAGAAGTSVHPAGAGGGGGGGSPGPTCTSANIPADGSIADFSDWNGVTGRWGSTGRLTGTIFSYHGPASTTSASVEGADLHFRLTGTAVPGVGDGFVGGGLSFDTCADAAATSGLSFTVKGTTGGCALELQIQTLSDKPTALGGTCVSGCTFATMTKLATAGTIVIPFSGMAGAAPIVFSPAEIVGVQWQLTVPAPATSGGAQSPCSYDLTFDDLKFVR